eukprot:SAG11_NODE_5108_length_1662_cov_1.230326_1_plen_62_part_00
MAGGFFIFNCFCKEDYPNSSPKVDIVTNGGGDVQCGHGPGGFNPNLYPGAVLSSTMDRSVF